MIVTPDKDLGQCVRGTRVVQYDRRKDEIVDEDGVTAKFGVRPASIADYLALVGDAADGFPGLPGWGAKSAAAVLAKFGSIDAIPASSGDWGLPGLRGAREARRHAPRQCRTPCCSSGSPPSRRCTRRRGRRLALARANRRFAAIADHLGAPHLVERADRLAERRAAE